MVGNHGARTGRGNPGPALGRRAATVADLAALMTGADPANIRVEVKAQAAGPSLDTSGWLKAAVTAAILVAIIRRVIRA